MKFRQFLKEKKIIPTSMVMKKFEEIYKKHKKVFDYLKDK